MNRKRVLLIEDDASLQRFIDLALDDMGLELVMVPTVDQGLAALHEGRFALIVTDLMLPGRSGFELIEALAAAPALQGEARLVVFSAGLNPVTRQRLDQAQVWRLLSKPCSVGELRDCVSAALETAVAPAAEPKAAEADAVHEFFGGDAELYRAFRASCIAQFRRDVDDGDRACQALDAAALRRLAHSLKSVLLTLGCGEASRLAKHLESSAEHAAWPEATPLWQSLRQRLEALD